jgi:septum formation protein
MLLEDIKSYTIILASGSPRRKELMNSLGIPVEIFAGLDIDESYPLTLKREEIPAYLAKKKSLAFPRQLKDKEILITADTIVDLNGEILMKPESESDAVNILSKISGNSHFVYTGVCIRSVSGVSEFTAATEVFFGTLSKEEIDYYITNYKPYDKAGAYGIQEWIGYVGIEEIKGSYFNVMGLPIHKLYRQLEDFILKNNYDE